jgi:hypothetical protein
MNEIQEKAPGRRKRNSFLPIPSRIILNEEGVAFFISHKRLLHPFETADGARHFGFRLEKAGFAWLKKLLFKGYIEKIEIQVNDITAHRQHLEDGIKMVFFSMFRRRINLSILEYVYESPMVRAWNRTNPKKSIGPGVRIAEKNIRDLLSSRAADTVEALKIELCQNILKKIPAPVWDIREDNRGIQNFIRELIEDMNPFIFFVLAKSAGEDKRKLMWNISGRIRDFLYNLDILNLASLLAIELVSAAERSSLVRLLENTGNIRAVLESPQRRKAIMEEKRFRGSTVVVAVPREIPRENRRLRFRLSVYNDGADAEAERKLMEDFTERSYSFKEGRHLEDFFKDHRNSLGSGVYEDNGLCFYYLTILQDRCRKNNILLDANIKESHSGESVVTTLRFGF